MAWYVGYGVVAESDERYTPVEVAVSNAGWGRGRGKEKRRDDCSSRAVGELSDLDMTPGQRCQQCRLARCCDGDAHPSPLRQWSRSIEAGICGEDGSPPILTKLSAPTLHLRRLNSNLRYLDTPF